MSVVGHGIGRAMTILISEPIVQILAAYMAVLYGKLRVAFFRIRKT